MIEIGDTYISVFKFYDAKKGKMGFKKRPVLVIGKADDTDYVVLPISRVTKRENLDLIYDIEVEKEKFPLMNLKENSYIRTHKQAVLNKGDLIHKVVNIKSEYSSLYHLVIKNVEDFQVELIKKAK